MADDVTLAQVLDPSHAASSLPVGQLAKGARSPGPAGGAGAGSNPDVLMQQIWQNAGGPLPLSASITTHGGTLAIFVAWSGTIANYRDGFWYPVGVVVSIDGQYVGQSILGTSSNLFLSSSNLLVAGDVEHGEHTLELDAFKGNLDSSGDDALFNLTVLEL